jgi:XTP/dITP diphosphohydrolase
MRTLLAGIGSNQYQVKIRQGDLAAPPVPHLLAMAAGDVVRPQGDQPLRLALATANPGKVQEVHDLLGDVPGVQLVDRPNEVGEIPETGDTFEDNARIKAVAIMLAAGIPALADDSGIEVDALAGRPGVYSARFGGEGLSDPQRVQLLLDHLQQAGAITPRQRQAQFQAVVIVAFPDGREVVGRGTIRGCIAACPRGTNGFGYDSVFIPREGDGRTFAEMSDDEKHRLSHRGRALRHLVQALDLS